jgi:hypothetical protein
MFKKLLVDHPYYCSPGCYWVKQSQCHTNYQSWEDFFEQYGDADKDMNFVWRWDLRDETEDDETEDKDEPEYCLEIFMMGQRKARPQSFCIRVKPEDEDAIVTYLQGFWERMQEMWAPISTTPELK